MATEFRTRRQNVMTKAWELAKSLKISFAEALKRAWKIVRIGTMEYFKITFVKESTGEITERIGSNAKEKNNNLLFFSLTDNGFRKAIIENIISIEPATVAITVA